MPTTWKPDPEDPTFELGWEGDAKTGERRRATVPPIIGEPSSEQDEVETRERVSLAATASGTSMPRHKKAIEVLKRLPTWAKISIPVVTVGIVVAMLAGSGIFHTPSEKDYRNAFSDLARANINAGGPWTQPAEYPDPLSPEEQEFFEKVKPVFLDGWCEKFAEGESAWKLGLGATVAIAKDDGRPVTLDLAMQRASANAAAEYICPRYKREAEKVTGHIIGLYLTEQ